MRTSASWVNTWTATNSLTNYSGSKRAIEDAKVYYVEALTAQPGSYNQTKVYETIWHETQLGAGLAKFYEAFRAHPKLSLFARIVLPREAVGGSTGEETELTSTNSE